MASQGAIPAVRPPPKGLGGSRPYFPYFSSMHHMSRPHCSRRSRPRTPTRASQRSYGEASANKRSRYPGTYQKTRLRPWFRPVLVRDQCWVKTSATCPLQTRVAYGLVAQAPPAVRFHAATSHLLPTSTSPTKQPGCFPSSKTRSRRASANCQDRHRSHVCPHLTSTWTRRLQQRRSTSWLP